MIFPKVEMGSFFFWVLGLIHRMGWRQATGRLNSGSPWGQASNIVMLLNVGKGKRAFVFQTAKLHALALSFLRKWLFLQTR